MEKEIVVTAICNESKGPIERSIWFMDYSPENIALLWDKCRKFPQIFWDTVHTQEEFVNLFLGLSGNNIVPKGFVYIIDDFVGAYFVTNVVPGLEGTVHYTFFDGKYEGRIELTKELMKYGFETFKFQRLNVEIPMFVGHKNSKGNNSPVFKFVENLGFKLEGRKRHCVPYKGDYFDLKLFGLLKSEV